MFAACGGGEHCSERFWHAFEAVSDGNQDVVAALGLDVVVHDRPELGSVRVFYSIF